MSIEVKSLHTYPLKSGAAVDVLESAVTLTGLEHDRNYMLVDDRGNYLSQRQIPELALVVPTIGETAITLSAPGVEDVDVPLELDPDDEELILTTVHGNPIYGQVVSQDVNAWFEEALPSYKQNTGYRLVKSREDKPRYIDDRYHKPGATNQVGFADSKSILVASLASLAALSTERGEPIPMDRFRPNIVVGGEGLPAYDEDYWQRIKVGNMSAFVVKACDRCVIPDTDQQTAEVGKDVRVALVSRRGVNVYDETNKGVFFAQNLNHVYEPGLRIAVGQTLEVIERGTEPNLVLRKSA